MLQSRVGNGPGTGRMVPASDWLHELLNLLIDAKCSQVSSGFKGRDMKRNFLLLHLKEQ